MNGTIGVLIPVLLPVIIGIVIGQMKNEKPRNIVFLLTLAIELGLVILVTKEYSVLEVWKITDNLSIMYRIDEIGRLFAVLISVIWLLAGIFTVEYIKHEERPHEFLMFYMISLGALISLSFAGNMMTMYFSYEMMTLLTFPLVIHTREVQAVRAGMKYIGYSIFGAGMGLFGFFFLNTYAITTEFVAGGNLNMVLVEGNETLLLCVFFIMAIGFSCKAGMFPLHGWLPTAHPVAPSPASAVLSGIITKGGVICLIRVIYFMFGPDFIRGTWAQSAYLSLAILTIFMGSMLAYKEKLLKKRLAYSTVSQISYVLFGLMLLTPIGFVGAMLQVVFHAIAKNILFLCAGALIYKTGKTFVYEYGGIGREMPIVMGCFAIATLSLIGIPPAGGFISKWFLAQGALTASVVTPELGILPIVGIMVLMISALLTAGYLFSIVAAAFFTGTKGEKIESKEPNPYMVMPLVVLSTALLLFGMFPKGLELFMIDISNMIF